MEQGCARVCVIRRQLNYRDWPNMPPQEKGIDVALAVDLIHLEMTANLRLRHVEVACWSGFKPHRLTGSISGQRNWIKRVTCLFVPAVHGVGIGAVGGQVRPGAGAEPQRCPGVAAESPC